MKIRIKVVIELNKLGPLHAGSQPQLKAIHLIEKRLLMLLPVILIGKWQTGIRQELPEMRNLFTSYQGRLSFMVHEVDNPFRQSDLCFLLRKDLHEHTGSKQRLIQGLYSVAPFAFYFS